MKRNLNDELSIEMDEKLKAILEKTLSATKPLAEAVSVADEKFLVILLGIHRVSFATLRDICYLSANEGSGSSILDLTRKILEYGISVEYMLLKGKERMVERFQRYSTVQEHDEIQLLKSIGQDPASLSHNLKIPTEEVEREYAALTAEMRGDKTWAGRDLEGMLQDLNKHGKLSEFDLPRLLVAYVWGCRLNHLNPLVVHACLEPQEHRMADGFYSRLGIVMALAVHLRISARLIDESLLAVHGNIYSEIVADLQSIHKELDDLE